MLNHINGHCNAVVAPTDQHTADRADIIKISAVSESDMLVLRDHIVGWVKVYLAEIRTKPDRDPGMAGVSSREFFLAFWRPCQDIATDIACRNAECPGTCDLKIPNHTKIGFGVKTGLIWYLITWSKSILIIND